MIVTCAGCFRWQVGKYPAINMMILLGGCFRVRTGLDAFLVEYLV